MLEKRGPFNLTRLLYPLDELRITFTNALLTSSSLEECIYWIAEIHASGWSPFPLIWEIYYDFYAWKNPSMFDFISRKQRIYDTTSSCSPVIAVVKNLRVSEWTFDVFVLRQMVMHNSSPKHIYRGKPTIQIRHDIHYESLQRSLQRFIMAWNIGRWEDITSYLGRMAYEKDTCLTLANIADVLFKLHPSVKPNILEGNLGSLLCYMLTIRFPPETISKPRILSSSIDEEKWYNDTAELTGLTHIERYDLLSSITRYSINSDAVSCFYIARNVVQDYVYQWRNFGEYYCKDCPYWNGIMSLCGASLSIWESIEPDDLQFINDEDEERFYDENWLHPDEQPSDVIERFIPPIDNECRAYNWIQNVCDSKGCSVGPISFPTLVWWIESFDKLFI